MWKRIELATVLVLMLGVGSCLFQNDPLVPNTPPIIKSYQPVETYITLEVLESITLVLNAIDPDNDQLEYRFLLGDSILSTENRAVFNAVSAGKYRIEGRAYDGSVFTFHDWHITVYEKQIEPPVIVWRNPDQNDVSVVVGDTLDFHFSVDPDYPDLNIYLFKLVGVNFYTDTPDFEHRFMELGVFNLRGIVWDGEYGDTVNWDVNVTGFPDTIHPSSIIDLEGWTGDSPGTIRLEWTAPGDDTTSGKTAAYIVRTSTTPVLSECDWRDASDKNGEPLPSEAGTRESMIVSGLNPGTYTFVTIRAIDDFFNLSPIGNNVHLLIRGIDAEGYVIDLQTGHGVEGIFVSADGKMDTTDASGRYQIDNLPLYTSQIAARDELYGGGFIGDYHDMVCPLGDLNWHFSLDLYIMPVIEFVSAVNPEEYYSDFLDFFRQLSLTTGRPTEPTIKRNWNHLPITVYNPEFVVRHDTMTLDLGEFCRGAMEDWEIKTGKDHLFIETQDESEADVRVVYDTILVNHPHYVKVTEVNPDGTPGRKEIRIYTKYSGVWVFRYADMIYAHEFGHILGMGHSYDNGHIMLGLTRPKVRHVSVDEANVAKIMFNVPYIFDFDHIKRN